jgi:XTP/dITP diphosphohydrolase
MELVFATNNRHKLEEVNKLLGNKMNILSLQDIHCNEDIPEEQPTLEGNALQKARYIYKKYGKNVFADDTGLEVEAIDWMPGVMSARYAGEEKNSMKNMNKLLEQLNGVKNRFAQFRTVIALIIDGKEFTFEGKVIGKIINEKRGEQGFGYDPIFLPEGYNKTFAELPLSEKNKISHRARAINNLVNFIKSNF